MDSKVVNKPILRARKAVVEKFDWGQLNWFANAQIGNSDHMTLGQCILKPGCENPKHYHPNCEEILQVMKGSIVHSIGDEVFEMAEGDTIVIPANVLHNARNVGAEEALMTIAFSSPNRQTQGEF